MSRKAKAQWENAESSSVILEAIRRNHKTRRRTFEDLKEEDFRNRKVDGRIFAHYWGEDDRKHSIYRYQWRWMQANGAIPDGMEIHHKNEVPWDDRLENLEMLTAEEHRQRHNNPAWIEKMLKARGHEPVPFRDYTCGACGKAFQKKPCPDKPHTFCSLDCYHDAQRSPDLRHLIQRRSK